jgi:large subunit ribosomal protein L18
MNARRVKRQKSTRGKLIGKNALPRLSVFRSSKHISVQLIDDVKKITIMGMSEKVLPQELKITKTERARELGKLMSKKAKEKKIDAIVFDRGAYVYHGRVKALAEGLREGGLKF